MTFQRKPKVIEFPPDHELHGLVVNTRRPRIEQIEAVRDLQTTDDETVQQSLIPLVRDVFGPALLSWNYIDEDGAAPPATAEGFLSIDIHAQLHILNGWVDDAAISDDLGKESGSGRPSRGPAPLPVTGTPALSDALANLHALPASSPFSASSPDTR